MTESGQYDIDSLLEEAITLPGMPSTLEQINEIISDPYCSLADVAKIISSDPSIALKTLRLVNSAYYGLGQEIRTIEHAVVLLGVKVIKNLALTATVFNTMQGSTEDMVCHAVGCGVAMRALAAAGPLRETVASPDEAFVYGLLHDIGKLIFQEQLGARYDGVAARAQEKGLAWFQAEREVIGVDHGLLGARLAEKWKLATPIVNAIAGHHDLEQSAEELRILGANLAIADYIISASGLPSHQDATFAIPEETWDAAGIASKNLPTILSRFFESFPTIHELLRVAL